MSQMPGDEVDDDDIVDRLGRIFKDMPAYTSCRVPEYSRRAPTEQGREPSVLSSTHYGRVVVLTYCASCRMTW
jgi:hypothetical protein